MRVQFFNPFAVVVFIALMISTTITLRANETWKGVFKLSQGEQNAEAIFDFESGSGILQLPDLIPVPLQLTKVSRAQDSVFFTIGLRSGLTQCKGKINGETMTGTMYGSRGNAEFALNKTADAPSIFGRAKPGPEVGVAITTHSGSTIEEEMKTRLSAILTSYDLEKYLYTKDIKIQTGTIPHSHPVLTINTRFENDTHLLSTFLHEQMHWYTLSKKYDNETLAKGIFARYPKVPAGLPEGGGDERSTYLHILVCYLEYHALQQVIGTEKAKTHIEFMTTQHYTWIYKTILKDYDVLKEMIGNAGLDFD